MNFLFDENMPQRLAKGLQILDVENALNKPPVNKYSHIKDVGKKGADDPDIVRVAKKMKAIIVSEDDDYKTIDATYDLVIKLRVGYVLFKPPRKTGSTYDQKVAALVAAWPELKKIVVNERPPFMIIIERDSKIMKYEEFKRGAKR